MNIKIAGVVVLFYPSNDVIENIKNYINGLDCLYIVDNSIEPNLDVCLFFSNKKIKYLHKGGENLGISKALNLALKKAEEEGYKWLLTMDQDTSFPEGGFEKYLKCFYLLSEKNKNVVLYSPLHNKSLIKSENFSDCKYSLNEVFMTSANLVNVDLANKLGGFDENLFIDEVDHEFCLKVIKKGYKTLLFNTIFVNHTLGTQKKINGKLVKLYPATRVYYMIRNFIYIKKKYKKVFPKFVMRREKFLIKFLLRNFFHSKEKISIIYMVFKAFWDAYNSRYGKRVEI